MDGKLKTYFSLSKTIGGDVAKHVCLFPFKEVIMYHL